MAVRVFSDFDGPLVDVSERYYQVYRFCVDAVAATGQQLTPLSKSEFWDLKRDRVPEESIALKAGFRADQTVEFARMRREYAHSQPYFKYDTIQPDAISALTQLRDAGVELAVMTMRRTRELEPALERFGLAEFFPSHLRYCLPNDYIKQGDTRDKPLLMARALKELPVAARSWMVGDTEADLTAGTTHKMPTIGLLCGIRNRQQLATYNPGIILPTLADATGFILDDLSVMAG
ncbi:MAG: HAD family hydrolase [Cyanobacteria bacterium P01_G01_bin.4]